MQRNPRFLFRSPRNSDTIAAVSPGTAAAPLHAFVYKSLKKADTYVYLAARDDFTRLPEPLRSQLGALQFVLDVALTPGRKLAREDAGVVRNNLATRGFHLQFPPTQPDPMTEDWGTDA
jgi:uncharacterized protein YcgL (UPF0745 family)